uniref:Uncharacterized protein n=1 Tax=Megaviridae environmental sample TaxID=1737588 RepID=A0A5J6VK29_9VIRU|nr:MAG: hypothetical protein [Megaviridae environmental sample]
MPRKRTRCGTRINNLNTPMRDDRIAEYFSNFSAYKEGFNSDEEMRCFYESRASSPIDFIPMHIEEQARQNYEMEGSPRINCQGKLEQQKLVHESKIFFRVNCKHMFSLIR